MADIVSWPIMTIIIDHGVENDDWWNHGHIDNGGWFWFLMQIETEYSSWAAVKADFASITGTIVDIWTFFIFNNVYHGPLSVIMVMIIKTQKKQLSWVEWWQLCHGNHHNNCWPFSSGHSMFLVNVVIDSNRPHCDLFLIRWEAMFTKHHSTYLVAMFTNRNV